MCGWCGDDKIIGLSIIVKPLGKTLLLLPPSREARLEFLALRVALTTHISPPGRRRGARPSLRAQRHVQCLERVKLKIEENRKFFVWKLS